MMVEASVVRPGPPGRHGDPGGPPEVHTLGRVDVFPRASSEDDERGQRVTVGATLYTVLGADVRAGDRVRVEGGPHAGLWDVEGMPARWEARTVVGRSVTEVALRRVTG